MAEAATICRNNLIQVPPFVASLSFQGDHADESVSLARLSWEPAPRTAAAILLDAPAVNKPVFPVEAAAVRPGPGVAV